MTSLARSGLVEKKLTVYGQPYSVLVRRQIFLPVSAPRLVIVAYQPNDTAREILRLCLESITRFTAEPHELWVVENCSPACYHDWLFDQPNLNLILNRGATDAPPAILSKFFANREVPYAGSHANAVALELAAQVIDPETEIMMTLHMDTVACRDGWLSYLRGKMNEEVRCVGVRMDETRVRTVHVLGMMFDFTLFRPLALTFRHNMPVYDVGDAIPIALEQAGYTLWTCRNTIWQPELVDQLPAYSPFRSFNVDRALNDEGEVIFMHLGRGIAKSRGDGDTGKTGPSDWLRFGRDMEMHK